MVRNVVRFGVGACLALSLGVASAQAQSYEQVSRADGVAGAAPLEGAWSHAPVITDDGRTAYMVFDAGYSATWGSATGIWRRDIDTNRSTQVVGGKDVSITGFTSDGSTLSFISGKRLSSADTNDLPDLYAYNTATKAITLVSRADGGNGAATGLDAAGNGTGANGYVTRDGKAALFATTTDLKRRDLTTGRTTTIAGATSTDPFGTVHALLGPSSESAVREDNTASADGRVFVSGRTLITPTGRVDLHIEFPGTTIAVSEDGAVAGYASVDDETVDTTGLTLITTATNSARRVDLATLAPDGYQIAGFSPDHASVILWKHRPNVSEDLLSVNLTSLASIDLGLHLGFGYSAQSGIPVASRNNHFALTGNLFATAANGFALPGGVDLPSANAYVSLSEGCKGSTWPYNRPGTPPSLYANFTNYGTAVRSFAVTVRNGFGFVIQTATVTAPTPNGIQLNTGGSGFKIQIVATYADNRTTNETWSVPNAPGCNFGI